MSTRKPSPPRNADNPEQSRRFIDAAREIGAEEPAEDADLILRRVASSERALKKVIPSPPAKRHAASRRPNPDHRPDRDR